MSYYNYNIPNYSPYNYVGAYSPYMQSPQPQQQITQQAAGLNGKIVDSEDVVRATEVPMGGYGLFPKADLSEIYVKSWNNNGTTSITTFKPTVPAKIESPIVNSNDIITKLNELESKIDNILESKGTVTKKEIDL